MSESGNRCPSCYSLYPDEVFTCPKCEAILNDELLYDIDDLDEGDDAESTIVRRMLLPPDESAEPSDPNQAVPEPDGSYEPQRTDPTTIAAYPEPMDGRLVLVPDIDLRDIQLTVFEAFVVSRVDGSSTIEDIRKSLELSTLEINVLIKTLKGKGIVDVARTAPKPRRPPPKPQQPVEPTSAPPRESVTRGQRAQPRSVASPAQATQPTPRRRSKAPPLRGAPSGQVAQGVVLPPHPEPPAHVRKRAQQGGGRAERAQDVVLPPHPEPPSHIQRAATAKGPEPPPPAAGRDMSERDRKSLGCRFGWLKAIKGKDKPNPLQDAIKLEKSGDLEGAILVLEEAIAQSQEPAPLYNRLAIVLVKERRDFRRAEDLLEKAQEADPTNRTYQNNMFKILSLQTKKK